MKKKRKVIVSLIVLTAIISTAFFIWKSSNQETIITSDGIKITVQKPIVGPDVGSSGNDFDNTFRSLTISPTNSDVVYIGNEGNALFKTTDGGATWEWMRTGFKYQGNHYPEVYDIAIDKDNESIVLMATTNGPTPIYSNQYVFPITAGVYRSENGGEFWTQYLEGLPNSAVLSIVQYPGRENTFVVSLDGLETSRDPYTYLENYGGVYISEDGGKSWSKLPTPDKGIQNRYSKLYVRGDENDPVFYTSGIRWMKKEGSSESKPDQENSIGLIRGDNEGQNWTEINPGNTFVTYFDVSADGNTIYAGDLDNYVLHISDDRGESWRTIQSRGIGAIKIAPDNKNKILYANGNQLILTEDAFATDKVVLDAGQTINDIEYFNQDTNIIYVSTAGFMVYKSIDGGHSFEKIVNLREVIDKSE